MVELQVFHSIGTYMNTMKASNIDCIRVKQFKGLRKELEVTRTIIIEMQLIACNQAEIKLLRKLQCNYGKVKGIHSKILLKTGI